VLVSQHRIVAASARSCLQLAPAGIVSAFRPQLAVIGRMTAYKRLIDWINGNGCWGSSNGARGVTTTSALPII
jgi:hypothetical protein